MSRTKGVATSPGFMLEAQHTVQHHVCLQPLVLDGYCARYMRVRTGYPTNALLQLAFQDIWQVCSSMAVPSSETTATVRAWS